MPKPKPVYQYDLYGNFLQEYSSLMEAERAIEVKNSSNTIRAVAMGKHKTGYGFQWRYKSEIENTENKIGLGKYNLDDDMAYLHEVWYSICRRPFNPNDERYDPNIDADEDWKESFDNFYYDIVESFEKFMIENKEYKKKLKKRHVWFSRIDKTKGWFPENTKFMTPDFCVRHKDETHKIIKDGRTLTPQMIVDELESEGIEIEVQSILKRLRENRGINIPNEQAKYKFNNSFYSLVQIANILNADYSYLKNRINNYGENIDEAFKSYKKHRPYSFANNDNLTKREYAKLLSEKAGIKRRTVEYRIDAGWDEKEIVEKPVRGENT